MRISDWSSDVCLPILSSLIVERENVPVGIITEKDFVKKICIKDLVSSKVKVGTIMSKIQTYASPDMPVEVAVQRMVNHKIRRLRSEERRDGIECASTCRYRCAPYH